MELLSTLRVWIIKGVIVLKIDEVLISEGFKVKECVWFTNSQEEKEMLSNTQNAFD